MENILVSACLFGKNTKYNGGNNYIKGIEELSNKYNVILYCPEVMGGLATPRIPSERKDNIVINKENYDVTKEFMSGAKLTLELVNKYKITKAILKDGSPSCGSTYIYDGSFTGNKIAGLGVTAELLKKNNIIIFTEKDLDRILSEN